ncbi:hypothetical protein AKJ65_06115 [candidate division MSBL1 archaeon SCGC-AAA259E19]|uniref:Polysaccharide pyruvyl transferase domain-containing protein n=1 Tax=candidate division MSBL1 archaeon SCGC-AAA259E19 TaxID=1698264 RepID=A0A133UHH8_9EURY|nr:hypothetical protein AKJ65_06115 [candidate division MSBL1 archaeon SCGC-AAA259E19]
MLHGYFGWGNVGDEAICSVLIRELEKRGSEVVVLSRAPERTTWLHDVKAIRFRAGLRHNLLSTSFLKEILRSQALVFAGGGKYGDATIRSMALLTVFAKLIGKKVIFRGVGIYPYEWSGEEFTIEQRPDISNYNLVDNFFVHL